MRCFWSLLLCWCLFGLLSAGPAEARAKGDGSLSLESSPSQALVRVDGLKIGRTPIRRHVLPAGAHRIEISNAVLGAKRTLQVVINPGKDTRLSVDLNQ